MMPRARSAALDLWHAGLHELSQPLTVLGMALTLAQASSNEQERTIALDAAVEECQRAMRSVREMRTLLDRTAVSELPGVAVAPSRSGEDLWATEGIA